MDDVALFAFIGLFVLAAAAVIPILTISAFVRVRRVEQAVAHLERRLNDLAGAPAVPAAPLVAGPAAPLVAVPAAVASPPAPQEPPPVPAAPATPAPVAPPAPAPGPRETGIPLPTAVTARTGFEWENVIAGRWLNRVGLTAVAIGVAYFLKHAIDNDWIGPRGQVALGILLGAALLAAAPSFAKKGLTYFADGLTGLGAAILYLSLWAAGSYYGFLSPAMTFAAMAIVTAAMLAIAIGRDSPRIAVMAMTGGFLTPLLVSTGKDAQVALFTYLALHNTALLVLAWSRTWRFLELPAFVLTQLYFWGWYGRFYSDARLASTTMFAALFFLQFSALSVIRSRRAGVLFPEQSALSLLNAFGFLLTLRELLWPAHRFMLAAATLALAVVYLLAARAVQDATNRAPQARLIFAGLALTFVTLAIPMSVDGSWITLAWAVEAAVLMWSGFSANLRYLRAGAFVLFTLVALRLAAFPVEATSFLLNPRFGLAVATAICAGAALLFAHQHRQSVTDQERPGFAVLAVAINLLLLAALTQEVALYYSTQQPALVRFERRLAESLAISLMWSAYATSLLLLGVRWSSALLRWQALALFALVSFKLFFFDLSYLSGFYRIISSVVLGVVLILISYLYQRSLANRRQAGGSEGA